ncbi:phosphotransferase [Mycobacterium crocinum]|uniref:Ecdysteroid 22-kinase family protein n=1 Tax=Mycolicibacterium crocinum TaxID=388459 RepID=A0ABY3TL43_9MYCO|nr:ecdysteroid 22-kinase family protein [Mycolicibacterium crocinum]MCV7215900.1 phosphotransferase [Mycolicibacterium crocinum]ULN40853.1 ecdysteroid 22-kinase family protein [Mycolicibacterium crocinum]
MTSATAAVPSDIDAVDPAWLTDALGATVTEVVAEQIARDSGFSSLLYRLHLTGDGVPATVIAKLAAQSEARGAMELLGGYRRELAFYREIAGRAPMGTPRVYTARMADESADFVLLLEDLRAWDNADHLAGLSIERARLCIEQLAGLHAWSVQPSNAPALQLFPKFDMPAVRDLLVPAFGPGWDIYRAHSAQSVPEAVARFAERFTEHAVTALDGLTERSMLLHGDIRADNMFFSGDRMKVVDFQFACVGAGVADIAYLVSQGLPTDTRRGQDEALLRDYLDDLGAVGYSFDEAWRHYRLATGFLIVLPVITLIGWDALPQRSRDLCLTLTDRAVATIAEIDALEVF